LPKDHNLTRKPSEFALVCFLLLPFSRIDRNGAAVFRFKRSEVGAALFLLIQAVQNETCINAINLEMTKSGLKTIASL